MRLKLADDYNALVKLGLPVLVTQLGIITVSFADTVMVGMAGTRELAAAAFVNSFFLVAMVMMIGFASGMTPLVGALYGRGEMRRIGVLWRTGFSINGMLGFAGMTIMGVLYFFLDYMGQDADLMPLIKSYYLIVWFTMLPLALFNCSQQMANGITDTALPMWIILAGNALNILGNYILIFGHFGFPAMGLDGAGISTLISRWAMLIAIVCVIRWGRRYREVWSGVKQKRTPGLVRKIWATSYPIMVQSGVECFLWSFGAVVCGWFGALQLASYQVVNTLGQLGFMTYMSFGVAVAVRVSNFTGSNNIAGIRRSVIAGLNIILVMATGASLFFGFGGKWVLGLITPDADVIAMGLPLIAPLILYQYCDAVQLTYVNALRGTSEVKPLLIVSGISYVVVGVPVLLFLAKVLNMGHVGVFYSFSAALLCAAVMLRHYFIKAVKGMES